MYAFRSLIFLPVARNLSVMASLSAAVMLLRNVVYFLAIRGEILPRTKLNWSGSNLRNLTNSSFSSSRNPLTKFSSARLSSCSLILEGARASTGLCVDVSSGVMI